MAAKLVTGAGYLISFVDGQAAGATNYFNYAIDLDINFVAIQSSVNSLVDEVRGIQGPNQVLPIDMQTLDQIGGDAIGVTTDVVVGVESYVIAVTDASNATISTGTAVIGSLRVAATSGFGLVPQGPTPFQDGPDFFNFVNLDVNGAPSIVTDPNLGALDLRRIEVNSGGTAFIVAPINIQKVGDWQYSMDGDAWVKQSEATNLGGITFTNTLYEEPAIRFNRIERLLSGFVTDLVGTTHVVETIGPQVVPGGSAATPGLILGDGTGTAEVGTGLFRIGANRFGIATAGALAVEVDAAGQLDLPLNFRVKGRRTAAQTIADATPADIVFSAADDFDIGTWHAADANFTVPTDGAGAYIITAAIEWAEAITNIRDIRVEIQLGGTLITGGQSSARLEVGEDHSSTVTVVSVLAATNVVTVEVSQDDTVGALGLDVIDATLSIVKVA